MKGSVDAAINGQGQYAGKAYFFKEDQYARYDWNSEQVEDGYPAKIALWNFPGDFARGVDAAINGQGQYAGKAYFFKGSQYLRYDWAADKVDDGYPQPINAWNFGGDFNSSIDAAINGEASYAGKSFFFQGNQYVRYDWATDAVDAGYPKPISEWAFPEGFNSGIDAALEGAEQHQGKAYFFQGNRYIRFDWVADAVETVPSPVLSNWRGLAALSKGGGLVKPAGLDDLTDVTNRVLKELNVVPSPQGIGKRQGKQWRNWEVYNLYEEALPDKNAVGDGGVINFIDANDLHWLKSWTPRALSSVDVMSTASDSFAEQELVVVKRDIAPDCQSFVFERPGDVFPKLVSVVCPNSLIGDDVVALPFYIYIHPTLGQAVPGGFYVNSDNLRSIQDNQYYPYGWDFLFHVLWGSNNYRRAGFNSDFIVGQAHQIAATDKPVITVVPILSEKDGTNIGDFGDPQKVSKILQEIHFAIASINNLSRFEPNYRVAIAAFSSSNGLLSSFLSKQSASFLKHELQEVYIFDPPSWAAGVIGVAANWANGDPGRIVRVYSKTAYPTNGLIGSGKLKNGFVVFHPTNQNRSYALLDTPFWKQIAPPDLQPGLNSGDAWKIIHSLIPSTMLTDAIQRSGF